MLFFFNRLGTILGSQRITRSLRHPPTTYPPPPSSPPGSLRCVLVDVLSITDYRYITVVCIMIPPSNRICNYTCILPVPIATVNKETDHVSWCIYLFYMFLLNLSGFLCLTLLSGFLCLTLLSGFLCLTLLVVLFSVPDITRRVQEREAVGVPAALSDRGPQA